jgi:hypothetical protein
MYSFKDIDCKNNTTSEKQECNFMLLLNWLRIVKTENTKTASLQTVCALSMQIYFASNEKQTI